MKHLYLGYENGTLAMLKNYEGTTYFKISKMLTYLLDSIKEFKQNLTELGIDI